MTLLTFGWWVAFVFALFTLLCLALLDEARHDRKLSPEVRAEELHFWKTGLSVNAAVSFLGILLMLIAILKG